MTIGTMKLSGNWLTAGALWGLMAASASLNAWGWSESSEGFVAGVLVSVAVVSEVLGMRLAIITTRALRAGHWIRGLLLAAFFVASVAFNAYSGHRAFEVVEARRVARIESAANEKQSNAATIVGLRSELAAERAALAALPTNVPAPRLEVIQRPHMEAVDRLERRLDAAEAASRKAPTDAAAPPIEHGQFLAIVLLIEALKALGLWAIAESGAARRREVETPAVPELSGKALIDSLFAAGKITSGDIASAHAGARWRRNFNTV